jgi:pyruvate dehydrogenase E2 component (dihydrolipoamide acetyltransferase)/2-oxoisovalerate dehydrogenase E2 component (dihydrolipoyl transacylase)
MDFRLPELGEGVYEAEFVSWLVKPGDKVKRGQGLAEVLTDKATMEVPAPFAGTVTGLRAEAGQKVKVGDVILSYETADAAAPAEPARVPQETANARGNGEGKARDVLPVSPRQTVGPTSLAVRAAPSVRLLARQLGIDLTAIHGTGPNGRILVEDVSSAIKVNDRAPRPAEPGPDYGKPGTRVKLQGIRRKVAEHMVRAKQTIPHYSYVDECDVTDLARLRESLKETFAQAGVKLTYLAFAVKAVAAALKDVPIVNATLDDAAGEIVLHDHYHIGIAVAAPSGLIVPVIRDADRKDLTQIAREIDRLSAEARAGKSRLEDLRGGTFTITSIGNIGGLFSTPVINHPEVGILGLGKIVKRPVFDAAGNVRPADMMYLSFSFDHRVVDGAVGAAFGNAVARRLQNPALLLLPEGGVSHAADRRT